MNVLVKKLDDKATLPQYQTAEAAGADIYACLDDIMIIPNGAVAMIPTGLAVEIPKGYEMQIRARSGLASKGLILPNGVGTIDSDYRGELRILVMNLSGKDMEITHEMRVAQAVISPAPQAIYQIVDALSDTDRGSGGFGSTGK